jgi:hypothetical protein
LLASLRSLRVSATGHRPGGPPAPPESPAVSGFWTAGPRLSAPPEPVPGTVRRTDALLEQLDPLELTAGRFKVADVLAAAYGRLDPRF